MRIFPQDFCMADAMPFQQHYECRTMFPIESILENKSSFMSVRDNLRSGDRITIVSYDKVNQKSGVSTGMRGIVNVRVVDVTDDSVELLLEAEPVFIKEVKHEPKQKKPPVLNVKKVFGGGFAVFDGEHAIDQFKTKVEATEYAQDLISGAA